MTITSAIANSFKVEILQGGHNFNDSSGAPTGNAFKIALYASDSASLSKSTTAYAAPSDANAKPTSTHEVSQKTTDGGATATGYDAGGKALTASADPVLSTDTACVKFNDLSWTSASFTANGCLIFNDSATGDPAVCAVAFGSDKTVSSGTFTIQFPAADASNAIVRIA